MIKLKNDAFTLGDILGKNLAIVKFERKNKYEYAFFPTSIGIDYKFKLYKSIDDTSIIMVDKSFDFELSSILDGKYNIKSIEESADNSLYISQLIKDRIRIVLDDYKKGILNLEGIKINLKEYQVEGETFLLRSKDRIYTEYGVMKYYSIISGQYVLFYNDGQIKSFDNIVSVNMTADQRLTQGEISKLWRKI